MSEMATARPSGSQNLGPFKETYPVTAAQTLLNEWFALLPSFENRHVRRLDIGPLTMRLGPAIWLFRFPHPMKSSLQPVQ